MKHPVYLLENQMVALNKGIKKVLGEISEEQAAKFRKYIDLILGWNRKISLISTGDENRIVEKHILPSLGLCKYIPNETLNWMDIGTGAGFPAIPVAIIKNEPRLLVVESTRKKAVFLMRVIRELELNNAKAIWGRFEELTGDRTFHIISARAVSNPLKVVKKASQRLTPHGQIFYIRDKRGVKDFQTNLPKSLTINEIIKLPSFTRDPRLYLMKIGLETSEKV